MTSPSSASLSNMSSSSLSSSISSFSLPPLVTVPIPRAILGKSRLGNAGVFASSSVSATRDVFEPQSIFLNYAALSARNQKSKKYPAATYRNAITFSPIASTNKSSSSSSSSSSTSPSSSSPSSTNPPSIKHSFGGSFKVKWQNVIDLCASVVCRAFLSIDVPPSMRCPFPVVQLMICGFDDIRKQRGLNAMTHMANQNLNKGYLLNGAVAKQLIRFMGSFHYAKIRKYIHYQFSMNGQLIRASTTQKASMKLNPIDSVREHRKEQVKVKRKGKVFSACQTPQGREEQGMPLFNCC
ncbi:uncharacterized protein MONOS_16315 [Monocercomonoides exilis]|uniref:uncharacterized protein n=1 Tax=Monocercomonoides exilis TaxID=2049356 RepID=UPI003559544D|nr:hypothetical protein MONOS_16315 [Monocercomonoides exilis]|eukprot:MONOS_16315.1-p1 / transcript=MONOS_16315.1 / gene=MONOS_16315 / organism=Monocercomonoides_exilis_PA203 / gene_product=unspecified product / transcript_product=unspecified product / location=Mono_scaffold01641:669-3215(+) / protein_length=296 / sequence_SO=supercontig / SO=protein_coding / is_pseudo=false